MKKIIIIFFLTAVSIFSGCMNTNKLSPSSETKELINTLKVVSWISQEDLKLKINSSNQGTIMLGGAAGALLDAAVEAHSEKLAEKPEKKYQQLLANFDFNKIFYQRMSENLSQLSWASVKSFEELDHDDEFRLRDIMASLTEDALLVLETHYSLSPDASTVLVDTEAMLYINPSLRPEMTASIPVSKRLLHYQSPSQFGGVRLLTETEIQTKEEIINEKYDKKISRFNENGRKFFEKERKRKINHLRLKMVKLPSDSDWSSDKLKNALITGIDQVGITLVEELNENLPSMEPKTHRHNIPMFTPVPNQDAFPTEGHLLRTANGYNLFRVLSGDLYLVPIDQPIR